MNVQQVLDVILKHGAIRLTGARGEQQRRSIWTDSIDMDK